MLGEQPLSLSVDLDALSLVAHQYLMVRWSCSTRLLRYFDWRSSMGKPLSDWMLTMAAVLEPLLSIAIFSGTPCRSLARAKNAHAAA